MTNITNIPLVSSEIGGIWDSFIGESVSINAQRLFTDGFYLQYLIYIRSIHAVL